MSRLGKSSNTFSDTSGLLSEALELGKKSFYVFPLRRPYRHVLGSYCAKKNGKYPASIGDVGRASCESKKIIQAFNRRSNANVGVLTGLKFGLVIIDIDFPEGGEMSMKKFDLPETLTAVTGNGLHLYYRHPGGKIPTAAGQLAPGIDVKGDRSFATAPPSVHATGKRYRWLNDGAEIASLPTNTINLLRQLPSRGYLRDLLNVSTISYFLLPISALLAKVLRKLG